MPIVKFKPLIRLIIVIIVCLCIKIEQQNLFAQGNNLTPIWAGDISNITWSANSQYLIFKGGSADASVNLSQGRWFSYDVNTNQLTESQIWPLQGSVPNIPIFTPINRVNSTFVSYVFQSPNGRFLIYAGEEGTLSSGTLRYHLTIADTQNSETSLTPILVRNPFDGPDQLNVLWSEDGTAFIVVDQQLTPVIKYVDGFVSDISSARIQILSYQTTNEARAAEKVYDLTSDGSFVLTNSINEQYVSQLVIWNTSDFSMNRVIEGFDGDFIIGASFMFNETGKILLVNNDGLVLYNISTDETSVLDEDINSESFEQAVFSPDGRWLALKRNFDELYVIDLQPYFLSAPTVRTGVPLPINKVRLSWLDNSTDETNFRIERSDNGTSGWSEIATVPANQTTYTETRTSCLQQSHYRIRAYRSSDQQYSEYTPVVSVTTDGCGPDRLALFNTIHTHNRRFTDFPGTPYTDYWLNAPVASGLWVMGDWDGNGVDTPAVFNQDTNTFAFTNGTSATSTWVSITLTVDGVPVAGRFNGNRANDCLGVVDDIPWGSDTAFALWFACDYTNLSPNIAELGYQWLGIPLGNSAGYGSYGVHQFVMGDFDTDGIDTVAVRRGTTIAYGNTAPTTQVAALDKAQYFGNPYNGQYGGLYGFFVAGDWDYDGVDTFGYFYEDGNFYWRNHLDWNQPISGSALISQPYGVYVLATTWRN